MYNIPVLTFVFYSRTLMFCSKFTPPGTERMLSFSIPMQYLEVWAKHILFTIFFPTSYTIKTFYSNRQQWEELKMTSFLLEGPQSKVLYVLFP